MFCLGDTAFIVSVVAAWGSIFADEGVVTTFFCLWLFHVIVFAKADPLFVYSFYCIAQLSRKLSTGPERKLALADGVFCIGLVLTSMTCSQIYQGLCRGWPNGVNQPIQLWTLGCQANGQISSKMSQRKSCQANLWKYRVIQPEDVHILNLEILNNSLFCNCFPNGMTPVPLLTLG